jgi:hypothetical protein
VGGAIETFQFDLGKRPVFDIIRSLSAITNGASKRNREQLIFK